MNSQSSFYKQLFDTFQKAENLGFPQFLNDIDKSTPLNSGPYLIFLSDIRSGSVLKPRSYWMKKLTDTVDSLKAIGLTAKFVIIGGSVLEYSRQPNDLDCAIFYTSQFPPNIDAICKLQSSWKKDSVDLRLIPSDGSQALVAKSAIFFSNLYAQSKLKLPKPTHSVVIVDCEN
jgi:hypothetical protein